MKKFKVILLKVCFYVFALMCVVSVMFLATGTVFDFINKRFDIASAKACELALFAFSMFLIHKVKVVTKARDMLIDGSIKAIQTMSVLAIGNIHASVRIDGLVRVIKRSVEARKADKEKLKRIREIANSIDTEMTENDDFNRQKIKWACALRDAVRGDFK